MSFDLSQLDRLAKGEQLQSEQTPRTTGNSKKSPTPRPRARPQVSRRKPTNTRRPSRNTLDCEEHFETTPSKEWTLSRKSDQESTFGAIQEEILTTASHTQADHDFLPGDDAPPGKRRKELVEETKKRTARQDRLEKLALIQDTSELPLCDLISRASYLEERTKPLEQPERKTPPPKASPPFIPTVIAPQVSVVDGRLVVNQASLEFSHQAIATEGYVRIEESDDRVVNYHSYGDWSSRGSKWSREETELLVQGIGQFGIDFSLLARLFPGRDRKQIKSKFSRMWKDDPRVFGKHFDRSEGESDDTYNRFVQDLKAERLQPLTSPPADE